MIDDIKLIVLSYLTDEEISEIYLKIKDNKIILKEYVKRNFVDTTFTDKGLVNNLILKCSEKVDLLEYPNIRKIKYIYYNNIFSNKVLSKKIDLNILLDKIRYLDLGYYFNEKITKLPKELEELVFGFYYNKEIEKNILPSKLKRIKFGYKYNKEIKKNVLPEELEKIDFGYKFNKVIEEGVLPDNIKEIIFSYEFNKKIKKNVLPKNLKRLKFGFEYNKKIDRGVLPNGLEYLKLSFYYDKRIYKGVLPETLKSLKIKSEYEYDITSILPKNLENFYIGNNYI